MYQQISQKLVKAARGQSKECSICDKKFELFSREHICKRCLRPVCRDCSPKKMLIVDYDLKPKEKHRVCIYCKNESKFQKKLRKDNELQFGKISSVSLRWLESLNLITTSESYSEISDLEDSYNKARSRELIQGIDITRMKKHFSYSFRQYAHQVQGKETSDIDIQKQLVGLLNKLAYRFDWKTLPHKFHLIAYFFLTVASEPLAYHLLVEIYTNYIPNYAIEFINDPPAPFDKNLSLNQKVKIQKILNYLTTQYKYSEVEQKYVLSFIQYFGLEMISTLFVDILTVEFFFTAINEMITKNTFMEIEKIFIMMTRYHHDYIKTGVIQQKEEYQYTLLHMIRNTQLQKLKEMSQEEKNQEHQQSIQGGQEKDSFETKVFKSASFIFLYLNSLANNDTGKDQFFSETEKMKSHSFCIPKQKENKPPQKQFLTSLKQNYEGALDELQQENDHKFNQNDENNILCGEFTPRQNQEEEKLIEQTIEDKSKVQEDDTESDASSENSNFIEQNSNQIEQKSNQIEQDTNPKEQDKSYIEQDQSILKNSIEQGKDISINQESINQENTTIESNDVEKYQSKSKEQELLESEKSFYQRQLQKKENDFQEKNEEIKKLQIEIKNHERDQQALNEQLTQKSNQIQQLTQSIKQNQQQFNEVQEKQFQTEQKYVKLEQEYGQLDEKYGKLEEEYQKLKEKYTRVEEKYQNMETQRQQFSEDVQNNSRLETLWKEFQKLQRKQEEIREEKVIIEQDFLSQKEQILVKHLNEIKSLKQEIEEYSKKIIQNEDKYMSEQNEHKKQILIFEKTAEENNAQILNLKREISYLNTQISSLKENEKICRKELSSKSELSQTYQNSIDNQIVELKSNLEQMKASNTSLIQEHKTLIELTNQNNNLIFEELNIQISEHEETIKKLNAQLEQSQSQSTQVQEYIQENNQIKAQLEQAQKDSLEKETLIKQKETQIQEKETLIDDKEVSLKEKEGQIKEKETLINDKEIQIQEKEKQIQILEKKIIEIQATINQSEVNQKQNDDLIDQLRNCQMEMTAQYKTDMELTQNNLKEEQEKCKEIQKQLEDITQELYQTKQTLEKQEQNQKESEKKINDLNSKIENNEKPNNQTSTKEIQQQLTKQNDEIIELNEQIKLQKDKLQNEENQINELNNQIINLQQESNNKQNIISDNDKEITNLKESIDKLQQEVDQQKHKLDNRCEEHEKNIKKLKSDLSKVNNELNKYLSIFQSVKQTVATVEEDQNQDEDS